MIAIILCLATLPLNYPVLAAPPTYSGGSGTSSDPYLIANEADLDSMATFYLNAASTPTIYYFSLTINITLTSPNFTPIGSPTNFSTYTGKAFNGYFNGNGHTISGLTISGVVNDVALFGVTASSTITNLGLPNVSVSGTNYVGGLIGSAYGDTITNCYVTGSVSGTNNVGGLIGGDSSGSLTMTKCYFSGNVTGSTTSEYVGGLVGGIDNNNGHVITITSCFTGATVTGNQGVGGLLGQSTGLNMSYCYANGNVTGNGTSPTNLGGIIGIGLYGTSGSVTIQYCYATGNVGSDGSSLIVGGLFGSISGTNNIVSYNVTHCYATGTVTGGNPTTGLNGYAGGLIGESSYLAMTYCYATGNVTGGVPSISNNPPAPYSADETYTGGLIGYSTDNEIEHCWSTGTVTTGYYIGGLIGACQHPYSGIDFKYCFSTGNVIANQLVGDPYEAAGGLVGQGYFCTPTNCYALGNVTGGNITGGFIGVANNCTISNCYCTGTGLTFAGGFAGSSPSISGCYSAYSSDPTTGNGTATTTAANYAGWDFTNVWTTNGDTAYPFFKGVVTVEPNGGYYLTSQNVKINANLNSNETVYYTTDGSTPTTSSSKVTSSGLPLTISVSISETVDAIVYDSASAQWFDLNINQFTLAASNAAEITAYSVPGQTGSANINSGTGTIGVTVPSGTNVTALVATFTVSAGVSSVKVGSTSQVSGTTANNFTSPVTYVVTAQDGVTTKNWVVTVTVAASNAAEITAYSVPGETGSANINSGTGTIGVTVPSGTNVTALVATFTVSAGVSSVKVGSTSQVSGTTANNFTSPVTYVVTAQDGVTTKNWGVTVTVAATLSSDATLSNLTISQGTLTPEFNAENANYTDSVTNNITSCTVTPTVNQSNATVTVNGTGVTSGSPSGAISLNVGANTITVVVTAQDGETKDTYTVTVTRAAPTTTTTTAPPVILLSSNDLLTDLSVSAGTLTPHFIPTAYAYADSVAYSVSSVTVTPTVNQPSATVTVNGTAVTSGTASGAISLKVGANPISVVVTAQDGSTLTYTLTVTRGPSNDATLSNLTISSGALSPAFTSATTGYADTVLNSVGSVTVTPTVNQANATVTVNGVAVNSGSASGAIALAVGPNTITLVVTAQDGSTKVTYTVTVTRGAPLSSDATLSNLTVNQGTLTPAFASATTAYSDSVDNTVSSVMVTPTVNQANATVTVNGVSVTSGMASGAISLDVGDNTIAVVVTAQDGTTTDTYTVTVTRAAAMTTTTPTLSTTMTTTTAVMTTTPVVTTPTITSVTQSTTSTQTSSGAKAAVIVPSVLGVVVIAGLGIFFLMRRRKEKIVFTTKPQMIKAGSVSQVITIQIQDTKGNPVKATVDTVIALSSSTGGIFAVNSDGVPAITSVTIKENTNSASFYYKDVTKGPAVITASSSVLATGRQTEAIN